MAAIIGPINNPRIPNCIMPASVDRTVIKVWSSALLWFIVLESFLIIKGRKKLSIKVPANITPKNKIISALPASPTANKYKDSITDKSSPLLGDNKDLLYHHLFPREVSLIQIGLLAIWQVAILKL